MQRRVLFACAAVAIAGCARSGSLPDRPALPPAMPASHAASLLTVQPSKPGAAVSAAVLGANMATWYDVTQPGLTPAFQTAGLQSTRWPGGSESDNFHWKTDSLGQGSC